ncbi:MAG: hypothetical protein A3H42_04155 [Deltaproteobacteria bacterium RIFCSPLOWO2_02_FULL_46_8]|nr:MAG: hypothetical protein A3H42_04155 [Deltaproteobacteria bacterium RIFCSPLOWO2_02_FULL_46_8]
MILKKIQDQLETFYRIELEYNVEDFIISNPSPTDAVQKKIGSRLAQEALFIKQTPGEMEIGLYVDEKILAHLQKYNPYQHFGSHNLNAFCVATEGVSHFLYLLRRAEMGQPVTQLELELQAEIDKYLMTVLLFYGQDGKIPEFLFSSLFENFMWDKSLTEAETSRYKEANRLAMKFCFYLDNHFVRCAKWERLFDTARQFYHLNHWSKIRQLTP